MDISLKPKLNIKQDNNNNKQCVLSNLKGFFSTCDCPFSPLSVMFSCLVLPRGGSESTSLIEVGFPCLCSSPSVVFSLCGFYYFITIRKSNNYYMHGTL